MARWSHGRGELGDGAVAMANCVGEMCMPAVSMKRRGMSKTMVLLKWMRARLNGLTSSYASTQGRVAL